MNFHDVIYDVKSERVSERPGAVIFLLKRGTGSTILTKNTQAQRNPLDDDMMTAL